jgi:hypothetical protein
MPSDIQLDEEKELTKVFLGQQTHYYLPSSDDIPENSLSKINRVGKTLWQI